MTEQAEEKGIVPAGAFDFAMDRSVVGESSQGVEGEPAQDGEVPGSMVLSGAVSILGKMDVEHPMESVLDAPMTAGDFVPIMVGGDDLLGTAAPARSRKLMRNRNAI